MLGTIFSKSLFLLFISINLVGLNDFSSLQLFYYNFYHQIEERTIQVGISLFY